LGVESNPRSFESPLADPAATGAGPAFDEAAGPDAGRKPGERALNPVDRRTCDNFPDDPRQANPARLALSDADRRRILLAIVSLLCVALAVYVVTREPAPESKSPAVASDGGALP